MLVYASFRFQYYEYLGLIIKVNLDKINELLPNPYTYILDGYFQMLKRLFHICKYQSICFIKDFKSKVFKIGSELVKDILFQLYIYIDLSFACNIVYKGVFSSSSEIDAIKNISF